MYKLLILSFLFLGCTNHLETHELDNPASKEGFYPRLFTDNSGTVFMSWYQQQNDTTQLFYSTFNDDVWSEPQLISTSDNWFVNWADFPSIIGYDGSPVAAHWLQKTPGGTYSYDVAISRSLNNFSTHFVPHKDKTATEHGFVSMVPLSDSSFYAVWLDGRNTAGGHSHDHNEVHVNTLSSAMTLRGALIQGENEIVDQEIDPSLCDCCNTSLVQTTNGLLVAYRDRTEDEIRDIYVSFYSPITNRWSSPKLVHEDNWQIAACPVNGPMMDSYEDQVALAWFTGANDLPKVKVAFSENEHGDFYPPILLDEALPLGRVDVVYKQRNQAWVSWMSRTNDSAELRIALVSKTEGILAMHTISEIDPSRSSGFPQLTKMGNSLIVAWTDINTDPKKIRTLTIQ